MPRHTSACQSNVELGKRHFQVHFVDAELKVMHALLNVKQIETNYVGKGELTDSEKYRTTANIT